MYTLRVKKHFDAAHYLKDYQGKCSKEHGHRWHVEVCVQGQQLDQKNMLIDFGEVKELIRDRIEDILDHEQLNDVLGENNPTAEFISRWIYDQLNDWFKEVYTRNLKPIVSLVSVGVWESPECCVEYSPSRQNVPGLFMPTTDGPNSAI